MPTRKFLSSKATKINSGIDAQNVAAIIDALSKVCRSNGEAELSKYLNRVSRDVRNI